MAGVVLKQELVDRAECRGDGDVVVVVAGDAAGDPGGDRARGPLVSVTHHIPGHKGSGACVECLALGSDVRVDDGGSGEGARDEGEGVVGGGDLAEGALHVGGCWEVTADEGVVLDVVFDGWGVVSVPDPCFEEFVGLLSGTVGHDFQIQGGGKGRDARDDGVAVMDLGEHAPDVVPRVRVVRVVGD